MPLRAVRKIDEEKERLKIFKKRFKYAVGIYWNI
jgi:hypothetical protein